MATLTLTPRLTLSLNLTVSLGNYFGNWNFRTKELSFPGTKVPWVELSFLGTFVPWNFRSQEASFPGTFVPMTDIKGELSFPNIGFIVWL